MTSRALTLLRAFAPALIVLVLLTGTLPAPSLAATPYDYSDGHEGDPGDGVLDPAIDGGDGGGSRKDHSLAATAAAGPGGPGDGDRIAVRVLLPLGGTLHEAILLLPRAWLLTGPGAFLDGRSPHAP